MELRRRISTPISAAVAILCVAGFGASASGSTFTVLGEFESTGPAASATGGDRTSSRDGATGTRNDTTSRSCGAISDGGTEVSPCGGTEEAEAVSAGIGAGGGISAGSGASTGEQAAETKASGGIIESDSMGAPEAIVGFGDRDDQLAALLAEASANSAALERIDGEKSQAGQQGSAIVAADLGGFAFAIAKRDSERTFLRLTSGGSEFKDGPGGNGGAALAPTPVPMAVWMLLTGLAAIFGLGRFWKRAPGAAREAAP